MKKSKRVELQMMQQMGISTKLPQSDPRRGYAVPAGKIFKDKKKEQEKYAARKRVDF